MRLFKRDPKKVEAKRLRRELEDRMFEARLERERNMTNLERAKDYVKKGDRAMIWNEAQAYYQKAAALAAIHEAEQR